jgi:hypothetical protein
MRAVLAVLLSLVVSSVAFAQAPAATSVDVSGVVTSQSGTVLLPGATVTISRPGQTETIELVSGEDGRFSARVSPGQYIVAAALPGFVTTTVSLTVRAGATPAPVALDLAIEALSASVDVVADQPILSSAAPTLAPQDAIGGKELEQLAPSGGLTASLRLLASIIETPGGLSIKGGRPSQAGMQIGPSTLIDPATGLAQFALPADAIDSVAVLPNPYAVEYGRFSSGLVVIQTRRASDQWKVRVNDFFDPAFRSVPTNPFHLLGLGWWGPRLEVGGPLIKERLWVEQTAQYRYQASDVPSRPLDELRTAQSFSSFTRFDGSWTPTQTFVGTLAIVPGTADQATLGTFTPPPATVDMRSNASQVSFTQRSVWNDHLFSETTVQSHAYATDVLPQGNALMEILPETTNGNFFNQQHRATELQQVISSLSGTHEGLGGLHLFKVGVDLLHSTYTGDSLSRDVLIETSAGALTRRLDYASLLSLQEVQTTDVALFAQDRLQPNARWYTEFGVRLDRDGVVERFNLTPRVGAAWLVKADGSAVLRGGFGLFFERTPSLAGAFDQFDPYIDRRFAADGTALGLPVAMDHVTAPHLSTPRSRTWDVSYEQRLNKTWSFHLAGIDREGSHELVIDPVLQTATSGALVLSSRGQSSYRGVEAGVHFAHGDRADLNASYIRSMARADLNSLTTYYDAVMAPVIGQNQYAPAPADVPNRFFARGRLMPTNRWLLLGIFDWRSGLPYSVVDQDLDFVGARNSYRFPTYLRLETGIERRFKILKFQPWIGVRIWNTLNSFLPTDVQANIASPAFGSFYNSEYRQFRIQVRFER